MPTGSLYGTSSETTGLYGNTTSFGGTYFEWFIFQVSETQPATPTGGTWDFTTNSNTPPTGWSSTPPSNPLNTVWVSIAIVNSRNTAPLVWSVPGKFAFASGLPIFSGNGVPSSGLGQTDQLYIQLDTTPQTIWFKESGTWTRITGSTLYADLTSNQTIAGTKTFSSQIQGSISGTASNVTGTVSIANGGTGSTTAGSARAALGAAASGANSDITSLSGLTTALSLSQGGTGATTAPNARTNLGLGSAAVLTAGAANGVATLDAGGTVPLSQIPASIQGGVSYQGTWNATTNTPTLTSSVGTKGHYYVVSVAGSTNLNGITSWNIGDWAIYNGTAWEKIDNTDAVTSVNGYTGTVVLTQPDIAGTASLTTTQTLTNKTLTSPVINEILDTNGNEILSLSPVASATDYLTVKNGIGVAVPLHLQADGPSANIGLHIQPKGTGLVTITDGTDITKGIRFRSSGSAASAVTLIDAVSSSGHVITLPNANTTLVGRNTTDTLTNKTFGDNPTFSAGTANGVAYLNGSKVLTTGSALTFDGTRLAVNVATAFDALQVGGVSSSGTTGINGEFRLRNTTANWVSSWNLKSAGLTTFDDYTGAQVWRISESEQMRLTSTGLGIGTSSPAARLDLNASGSNAQMAVQNWPMLRVIGTTLDIGGYNTSQWTQTRLYTNGSIAATLDSSGNLGLGVTPSANTIAKAFELQNGFNLFSAFNIGYINANAYFDGNWKYKNTAASGRYEITDSHKWFTAPSGTAGNAISFTQAMSLTADGNLAVGLTSTSFRVNATVQSGANRDVFAAQIAGASNGLTIKWNHATTTTRVNISNLPTSASGLASGDLWNDGGTLKIA